MASGSLGAEEAREKPRWNENSKVYTRKIKSKTTQNSQNTLQPLNAQTSNGKSSAPKTTTVATTRTATNDGETAAATIALTKSMDDGKPVTTMTSSMATDDETLASRVATDEDKAAAISVASTDDSDKEIAAIPLSTTNEMDAETTDIPVATTKDMDEERAPIPLPTTQDTHDEPASIAATEDMNEEPAAAALKDADNERATIPVANTKVTDDQRAAIATTNDTDEERPAGGAPVDPDYERAATTVAADAAIRTAANNEHTATMSTCLTAPDDNGTSDNPMPDNANGVLSLEDRPNNGDSVPAIEINTDTPPRAPAVVSPSLEPAEDVNNDQQRQSNSLRTEAVVSEDSSTLNQQGMIVTIPNGGNQRNIEANGLTYVKPAVTRTDGKVSICLSAFRTKKEAKDLKRKLVGELQMVRSVCRKLEDKEVQMSVATNSIVPVNVGPAAGGPRIRFPVNDGVGNLLRVNTQAHSAGFNESRPFRTLSVSVVNSNLGTGEVVEKEKRTPKANQFYRSADFIYGKDKLPPAESNKKHKSSSKKHHGSGGGVGGFTIDKQLFKKCSSLLQRLMKHKHGWVFNTPVDVKGLCLHDYYDIIKQPMDLGTVKNKLNRNWYKSPFEFAEDVRLTFRNARTYNPEGQDVHVMAVELSDIFEEKWAEIEADYNRKLRYEMSYNVGLPTPRARVPTYVAPPMPYIPAPSLSAPYMPQDLRRLDRSESLNLPIESRSKTMVYHTPATRTPAPKKPKAKDPNKRDMTFEEKQRLSTHLQALPSEKLDNIVQIIKKRNSALSQREDEIEVDIDSVDAETLWELDRFVTNYKKSLSKHKRKAELALQAKAAAEQAAAAQQTIPAPSVEVPREMVTDETNVAASSPVQEDKQTNNASGSSSSSSSSSDSGSSSSDSDSDSSSGSGSGSDGGP